MALTVRNCEKSRGVQNNHLLLDTHTQTHTNHGTALLGGPERESGGVCSGRGTERSSRVALVAVSVVAVAREKGVAGGGRAGRPRGERRSAGTFRLRRKEAETFGWQKSNGRVTVE